MLDKLQNLKNKLLPLVEKLYTWSPFLAGALIGYYGKPVISLALNIAKKLITWIL